MKVPGKKEDDQIIIKCSPSVNEILFETGYRCVSHKYFLSLRSPTQRAIQNNHL